jgi:hypothetical protein
MCVLVISSKYIIFSFIYLIFVILTSVSQEWSPQPASFCNPYVFVVVCVFLG